eukprot:scaffold556_cov221-Pinguiococcus_pyrenoidosus.AAC.7
MFPHSHRLPQLNLGPADRFQSCPPRVSRATGGTLEWTGARDVAAGLAELGAARMGPSGEEERPERGQDPQLGGPGLYQGRIGRSAAIILASHRSGAAK